MRNANARHGTPRPLPGRLAYNQRDAAAALSVSVNTFVRSIAPDLPCIYIGRRRLYPVRELERWLERTAKRPFE
jgi:hypothetical protein